MALTGRHVRRRGRTYLAAAVTLALLAEGLAHLHAQAIQLDVALVIDTSLSMAKRDPQRRALLVTNLLSDLVEGQFAVTRLRALTELPTSPLPGGPSPCPEDPSRMCTPVRLDPQAFVTARREFPGTLVRERVGAPAFRQQLGPHLNPESINSQFDVAFAEAAGVFESHGPANPDKRRTLVWLSDGETDGGVDQVAGQIRDITTSGVRVEPLLFGADAKTELVGKAGLTPKRIQTSEELIPAFAEVFKQLVGAAHMVYAPVQQQPTFDMRAGVDEAWVIVYGDTSLKSGLVTGPSAKHSADAASYSHQTAGAYRVVHLLNPMPGSYTLTVDGGGPNVAYAVIQTALIRPALIAPGTVPVGAPTQAVVELRGRSGQRLTGGDLPANPKVSLEIAGATVAMTARPDGTFVGDVRIDQQGTTPVRVHLVTDVLDRYENASITASGQFRYTGGPLRLDFGTLGVSQHKCQPVDVQADQIGPVRFTLAGADGLPSDHALVLRAAEGDSGSESFVRSPNTSFLLCLDIGARAESSAETGRRAELRPEGYPGQSVPLELTWEVNGLTWWDRYKWLILSGIALAIGVWVIYGYIKPQRWPRGLSVSAAPNLKELALQMPVPIKVWKGTGIGFYRDARAYLHPDYRVSGKKAGATLMLEAQRHGIKVHSTGGSPLFLHVSGDRWEDLNPLIRPLAPGDTVRVGQSGPCVRLHVEGQQ
jgi:hypothetical protein